jgi:chromosome partitioning protein
MPPEEKPAPLRPYARATIAARRGGSADETRMASVTAASPVAAQPGHDPEGRDGGYPLDAVPIVAFANQKGGVGKTTTAVNSAVSLAQRGYRVLIVDSDPQGNATSSLGVDKLTVGHSIYDVLVDGLPLSDAIDTTDRPGLDLVAATPMLAGAEIELVATGGRETRLREALAELLPRYDVVLIDCPPSLGLLTVNALTAARSVVVPIQCEFLALEGLGQLMTTVDRVKRGLNPSLDVAGVLMTMFDARTRLSAHVVDEVRRYFPHRMFGTVVPRSVRLAEAPSYGQAIVEYDPSSRGAEAYEAFVNELTTRLHLPPRRRLGRESAEGSNQ